MNTDPQSNSKSASAQSKQTKSSLGTFAEKSIRIAIPITILAIGGIGYSLLSIEPEEAKKEKEARRPIKTQVVELRIHDYPTRIVSQGNIRPHNEISLNSEVSGQIVRISPYFEDGAFFKMGEVLIELDPSNYQAAVANAEAQLARTTATYALEKAQADQARANWVNLGSTEEPDDLVLRIPQLRQAEANVKAASAQLDRANQDLKRTKILAPFNGRVRKRLVGLGQAVRNLTPLGTVFDSDYAEIRLPITGSDLPLLKLPEGLGDPPVDVILKDALNTDNKTEWKASIVRTEGTLDASSLELFAIANVDDPFGIKTGKPPLRIGQPVTAHIFGEVLESVMALPRVGVKRLDQVYLVDPLKLTLHNRTIDVIWADQDHVIIRDPNIPDGSLLATTKLSYAPEGAKVEILPDINPNAVLDITLGDPKTGKPEKDVFKGGGKKSGGI